MDPFKEGCATTIKEAWGRVAYGEDYATIMNRRLSYCSSTIKKWNAKENRNNPANIKQKMTRLSELQEEGRGEHVSSVFKLQSEIEQSLAEEDLK